MFNNNFEKLYNVRINKKTKKCLHRAGLIKCKIKYHVLDILNFCEPTGFFKFAIPSPQDHDKGTAYRAYTRKGLGWSYNNMQAYYIVKGLRDKARLYCCSAHG